MAVINSHTILFYQVSFIGKVCPANARGMLCIAASLSDEFVIVEGMENQ